MLEKKILKQLWVLLTFLMLCSFANGSESESKPKSVKKELKTPASGADQLAAIGGLASSEINLQSASNNHPTTTAKSTIDLQNSHIVDLPKIRYRNEDEIPESYKTGFYIFIGLSVVAVLFILFKIYGLRLSRAERKYGVHGDRSTQELTPLPITIEDDDSENDDHTLFELNRQIRVM